MSPKRVRKPTVEHIDDLREDPRALSADDDPDEIRVGAGHELPKPGRYPTDRICTDCGERLEFVVKLNAAKDLICRFECSIVKAGIGTSVQGVPIHEHFDEWKKLLG